MKKIKLFLLAFIFTATLALASCSAPAELEYTNEEGELVTLNVKPTEDKEEVYEAMYALGSVSETELEEVKAFKVNMDAKFLIQDDSNLIDVKFATKVEMNDKLEMYANIDMAAKYDLDFGYGMTQSGDMEIDGDVYCDAENIYMDLATKENGTKNEMKNKMALVDAAEMLEDLMGSFDFDSMVPGMGSTSTILGIDFSEKCASKGDILAYIEENNITIAKTTKSSITFKAGIAARELGLGSDAKLDVLIGIDVNTLMPVSLEIDADDVMKDLKEEEDLKKAKLEFKFELEFADIAVKTLKESEKDEYVDFSDASSGLFDDVFGSLYF